MLTWLQLACLSDDELRQHDVAAQNLACAVGLPGYDGTEIPRLLRRVDEMAEGIGKVTRQLLPRYRETGYQFEARWRVSLMIKLLWRDYGVRYNPAKIPVDAPLEPADTFLHGILEGQGGTCASLPVFYTAVGRRLGYPIKLVGVQDVWRNVSHGFCRWEGPDGETFNIEGNKGGLLEPPDDYYRTENRLDPQVERIGRYLQSKTPKEELARFLMERGHFRGVGRFLSECAAGRRTRVQTSVRSGKAVGVPNFHRSHSTHEALDKFRLQTNNSHARIEAERRTGDAAKVNAILLEPAFDESHEKVLLAAIIFFAEYNAMRSWHNLLPASGCYYSQQLR